MYNLKNCTGTFKGLIGECLFKLTRKNVILPRFFNRNKFISIFDKYLNEEQRKFICDNWYSFDALEVDYSILPRKIIIYEVKTRNYLFAPKSEWKYKMTYYSSQLYKQAQKLGFLVRVVSLWLFTNWNFDYKIYEFDPYFYCIDKPKKYDKKRNS